MAHSFFKRAFEGNNKWWTFLVGILLVSAGHAFGQLPITVLLFGAMASMADAGNALELQERVQKLDFEFFGINQNLAFFLILISFVTGVLALWFALQKIHKRPFMSIIAARDRVDWSRVAFGFGLWMGLSLIGEGIAYFIDPNNYVFTLEWQRFLPLLLICLLVLPFQTSFEEFVMRGYLMQGLVIRPMVIILTCLIMGGITHALIATQSGTGILGLDIAAGTKTLGAYLIIAGVILQLFRFGGDAIRRFFSLPVIPLVLTSLCFGLLHGMNPEVAEFGLVKMMIFYIGTGFFLGLITLLDESLEIALGIHFANNLFGALFVSFEGSALQTPTMFRMREVSTDYMVVGWLVMVTLFMLVAMAVYRWKDWGKLFRPVVTPTPPEIVVEEDTPLDRISFDK